MRLYRMRPDRFLENQRGISSGGEVENSQSQMLKSQIVMNIRVLHVLDHSLPYFSGYSFRTNAILTHQLEYGIQPIALTSPKHANGAASFDDINAIRYYRCRFSDTRMHALLTTVPFVRERLQMSLMERRIESLLSQKQIDIVHAHSPSLNGIPAVKAAKRFGIPAVYEVRAFWEDAAVDHGTFGEKSVKYKISTGVESWLLRRAAALTTLGESMRQEIVRRGLAPAKVHVIPNGVDLNHFSPRNKELALCESLSLLDKTILGFIGSFYRYEGLDLLIRAMAQVIQQQPKTVLILVGDGDQRPELEKLASHLGLSEHITFTGKVPHDKVADYYSIMDILVYPRKSMRLTELVTPLKPLEAMAMGKTVLGSDVGGIKELVREGETGFLFRANDLNDLANKCIHLVTEKALRQRVAIEARKYVERERNWQTIVSRYRSLYESLLDRQAYKERLQTEENKQLA